MSKRRPEPLVLRVIPDKLMGTARMSIGLGVFLVGICTVVYVYGAFLPLFFGLFLVIGLLLIFFGVLSVGIARNRPVALRLDQHGVSGYYVPTLNWTEILRFDRAGKGRATLAFELFDRAEVRKRQTRLMWRFNLSLPLGDGWHILVPGDVLDDDIDRIVATGKVFQAAAIARDQRSTGL